MAHDYAKRPRARGKKKKTGISSGPIWLVTGVFCGLFLAFLLQLAGVNLAPERAASDQQAATADANSAAASVAQQQAHAKKKPRFEFYSLLPEAEVDVQEEAKVPVAESSFDAQRDHPIEQSPGNRAEKESTPASSGTHYVLQTGSFKRKSDADRLRARLLLMGFEVNVERKKMGAFDSRHRVLVGPYNSRRETAQARNQLTSEKVDTLVLERKYP